MWKIIDYRKTSSRITKRLNDEYALESNNRHFFTKNTIEFLDYRWEVHVPKYKPQVMKMLIKNASQIKSIS